MLHEACVSDFAISKYEVTEGQWRKVMGRNPSQPSYGSNYPITNELMNI